MSEHITASPLCWPAGWLRAGEQQPSRFGRCLKRVTIHQGSSEILHQLNLMGIPDFYVIISTDLRLRKDGLPYSNQRDPDDKGVSVWWWDGEERRVIALDKYDRIADNLWAIAKTLDAMRGIERWGGGEILNRTFTGFTALPDPESISVPSWRELLDYYGDDLAEANKAYKKARAKAHPDCGGSSEQFYAVNQAWAIAEAEIG